MKFTTLIDVFDRMLRIKYVQIGAYQVHLFQLNNNWVKNLNYIISNAISPFFNDAFEQFTQFIQFKLIDFCEFEHVKWITYDNLKCIGKTVFKFYITHENLLCSNLTTMNLVITSNGIAKIMIEKWRSIVIKVVFTTFSLSFSFSFTFLYNNSCMSQLYSRWTLNCIRNHLELECLINFTMTNHK